jgi:4-hydroxythreonine-4-phosphate dehydrogenase
LAPLLDPGFQCEYESGHPTASSGYCSFAAVRLAVDLALKRLADAVVTAPISKESWRSAGVPFLDHTGFLEEVCARKHVAMMLVAGDLRAVPVTRHIPLARVSGRLTISSIVYSARLTHQTIKEKMGIRRPALALCAFNPHAGESGMFGTEERDVLLPAIKTLKRMGIPIDGPIPADAAWAAHSAGLWDALLTLYHDQAMIPMKVACPYAVINWTLGIPIIRTAPGHGTAFDIAGQRKANPEAMIQAILLAASLSR